jgi:hypothetical protein
LRITTVSPLPPAIVGVPYLGSFTATGGSPPYSWSITSGALPPGLVMAQNGSISGIANTSGPSNLTAQVTDSGSGRVSQAFLFAVLESGTLPRLGVVSHLAAGDTWSTAITLVNTSQQQAVPLKVNFYHDDGSPLTLPITIGQQGAARTVTASTVETALNPNTTLLLTTGALNALVVGWAEVLSPGPLNGFAIFRTVPPSGAAAEATVPLETQTPSTVLLPFDNTTSYVTGAAFANASPEAINVTATIFDETGAQLTVQSFPLPGKGHGAFVMPTQFPVTAGKRGLVRFVSTGTGGLAGVGLRFSPFGTFTSVPTF